MMSGVYNHPRVWRDVLSQETARLRVLLQHGGVLQRGHQVEVAQPRLPPLPASEQTGDLGVKLVVSQGVTVALRGLAGLVV